MIQCLFGMMARGSNARLLANMNSYLASFFLHSYLGCFKGAVFSSVANLFHRVTRKRANCAKWYRREVYIHENDMSHIIYIYI